MKHEYIVIEQNQTSIAKARMSSFPYPFPYTFLKSSQSQEFGVYPSLPLIHLHICVFMSSMSYGKIYMRYSVAHNALELTFSLKQIS